MFVLFTLSISAQNQFGSGKIKTICIDAGHGGRDPGALGKSIKEKEVALAIALKLGKLINGRFPDINVVYTRQEDVFIELYQRAEIANKAKADLFISIHANSNVKKEANGVEFWVLGLHKADENLEVAKKENAALQFEQNVRTNYGFDPNSPEGNIIMTMKQSLYLDKSIQFAKAIENKFTADEAQVVRGTKQAGFLVLYKTAMPGVLVEIGFISNPDEEQYMSGDFGQQKIANKIVNAFADYKRNYENGALNSNEAKLELEAIKAAPEKKTIIVSEKTLDNSSPIIETISEEVKPVIVFGTSTASTARDSVSKSISNTKPDVSNKNEKQPFNSNSPSSKILTQTPVKRRIIIDEELDRGEAAINSDLLNKEPSKNIEIRPNNKRFVEFKPTEANKIEEPVKQIVKDAKLKGKNNSISSIDSINKKQKLQETKRDILKVDNEKPNINKQNDKLVAKEKQAPLVKDVKLKLKENIIDKSIDDINTNEKRTPSEKVPSYINNLEIKKEIINNTKNIDKSYKKTLDVSTSEESIKVKPVKSPTNSKEQVFKVQIKASGTKAKENDIIFTYGLEIEESAEDGMYKYLVGNFNSESEAIAYKLEIRGKGAVDAFVVKYLNGKRVK